MRAYSAATLWSVLFSHQGVKAAINNPSIRNEISLLQGEYQRQVDIKRFSHFVEPDVGAGNYLVNRDRDVEDSNIKQMDAFTLQALDGILHLLEAKN